MIKINLLPKHERGHSQRKINWLKIGTIFAAALTVLVLFLTLINTRSVQLYRGELQSMQPQTVQLNRYEKEERAIRQQNGEMEKHVNHLENIIHEGDNVAIFNLLKDVAQAAPTGLWLENFYLTVGGPITSSGYALQAADVAAFLRELETIPGVSNLELSAIDRKGQGDDSLRGFGLRITWEGNPQ